MELYLIRHGETVDNVAGLYAGVRDSALTIHGVEQARRLGEHFAKHEVHFSHIFASPLSRALKTAQAVHAAQKSSDKGQDQLSIAQVPDLIEQDFGHYEGKSFHARTEARKTGKESHREKHIYDPDFVDVESKESLNKRADAFLDQHMIPLFEKKPVSGRRIVAIVSHGILLSHLWRRLLARFASKSVTVAPEVIAARDSIVLEHLGGWSNTGYLELVLSQTEAVVGVSGDESELLSTSRTGDNQDLKTKVDATATTPPPVPPVIDEKKTTSVPGSMKGWTTMIRGIDRKEHLTGLKRQRGGIGRSAHDEGQKKLDGFFKRQRTG
ncbi:Adenosylcobalamin/alpha-ribazole phosphatase [Fulvia fulva]|uniref:Adenosylcobalamin/alpha-ribazole phosphatase n=1 Tax=Passalora fulva TaxID=5499 RepID=A0A9Q8P3H8_PASFU|nr:Adenosylcobalamin/alpha-ribazole phosphatase [Fulvia fulva]KAK4636144.1 Adenosylcobalamin/alpha-ribazole phosphatase [Fulvia fulva]KAK4637322.1 Adenosylcobalamin/alpha-ribazole phosphatase [Fulvia fulva]UJO12045.1 Adenosylcobalamin/alpha-ribazole phosphatase [Fulvia fulva]WPV08186.1 Adenosylcobalamin/alpha-ribazole phosphatase [Fulvia fulva]WPV23703.1 Adenosylcobalamin/alpha-ribazole phosphatase [Fulvia fulva]